MSVVKRFGTAINNKGKTEKNKKIKEGECIFPFKYKWKVHDRCFQTPQGDICATEINPKTRTPHLYLEKLDYVGKVLSFYSIIEIATKLNNDKYYF